MDITEYEVYTFLLGAAAGSVVTYYITTREKRIISNVRRRIEALGALLSAENVLTKAQYLKTSYPNQKLVSDQKISEIYGWAERIKKEMKLTSAPIHLTTLVIICEGLLGLSWQDAIRVSKAELNSDGLPTALRSKVSEKKGEPLGFMYPDMYRDIPD